MKSWLTLTNNAGKAFTVLVLLSCAATTETPVMSRRDCDGIIAAQRCYIYKPGPRSEEPFTGEEWRALLDRCVRAGRENMLDAIRHIVQGHAGTAPPADALTAPKTFAAAGLARWRALVQPLPPDDPARLGHGFRELAFEIRNVAPLPALSSFAIARMSRDKFD